MAKPYLDTGSNAVPKIEGAKIEGAASGQNISHLFGRGTTVLIGPVWYLGLFLGRSGPMVFRKVTKDTTKTRIF